MAVFIDFLAAVYAAYVFREKERVSVIEEFIGSELDLAVGDNLAGERDIYVGFFSGDDAGRLVDFFDLLLKRLRCLGYEESSGIIDGLAFIQLIGATALWRYSCSLDVRFEKFVRDYDRLDVESERRRLFMSCDEL